MRLTLAALLLLLGASSAQAQIYMCENNGQRTYSQQPCGKNAKTIDLPGQSGEHVTLSDSVSAGDARNICRSLSNAVTGAAQMNKDGVNVASARGRTFDYLRNHIDNYNQLQKDDNAFATRIEGLANIIIHVTYRSRPSLEEAKSSFEQDCAESLISSNNPNKPAPGSRGAQQPAPASPSPQQAPVDNDTPKSSPAPTGNRR